MTYTNLYTVSAKNLSKLPVRDGNIIFVTDSGTVCLYFNGGRYPFKTIQTFATEEDRIKYTAVIEGYYYVTSTNVMWSFSNGSWQQMTPDNLEPIVFATNALDFPKEGNPKTLYVADKATYKWSAATKEYIMVSNLTEWNQLES